MVVPSIILVGYTVGQTVGHTVDHTCVVLLRRIVSRLVGRSIICQSSGRYRTPLSVRYCTSVGNLFLVIAAAIVRYCSRVRAIVVIPIIVPGAACIIRSSDSIVRPSRTRSRRSRPLVH